MRISHHLRFHVARLIQILLHEALAPAEGRGRLAHRRGVQLGHLVHLPGHLQPPATAAERRLDGNGQPMLTRKRQHLIDALHRTGVPATSGAPTDAAMRRAATLSPSCAMVSGLGPIHTSPASITACANPAFSDRKP